MPSRPGKHSAVPPGPAMAHVVKQPRVAYVTEWSHVFAARNVVHVARHEEVVGTVAVKLKVHRRRNPFDQLSTHAPMSALWHRSRLRVDVDSRPRASALREPAARRAHHMLVASASDARRAGGESVGAAESRRQQRAESRSLAERGKARNTRQRRGTRTSTLTSTLLWAVAPCSELECMCNSTGPLQPCSASAFSVYAAAPCAMGWAVGPAPSTPSSLSCIAAIRPAASLCRC